MFLYFFFSLPVAEEWTVVCTVDAETADIVSLYLFDAEATAISEKEAGNSIVLRAGFPDEASARSAVTLVDDRVPSATCRALLDTSQDDWIEAQRQGLSPTTVRGWNIRAPWHSASTTPEQDIVIDPGAAFGHGAHHSTRLAADLLLRILQPGDTVVDLGTGTGVIAILAAKVGANVRAIEDDPVAVDVAAANIERNGVGSRVELITGDAGSTRITPTDIVVANVTLDVHRLIASNYERAHRVIVAGILCSQVSALSTLFETHIPTIISTSGEWAAIDLVFSG